MTLQDYQHEAAKTGIYDHGKAMEYLALGLASEAGEVAGKIKKIIRDKERVMTDQDKIDISLELGDVLWYVSEMARVVAQTELENVGQLNVQKLRLRQQTGTIGGSGDHREEAVARVVVTSIRDMGKAYNAATRQFELCTQIRTNNNELYYQWYDVGNPTEYNSRLTALYAYLDEHSLSVSEELIQHTPLLRRS